MNIAITGSTGLIGNAVTQYLSGLNHDIVRVYRPSTDYETNDQTVVLDLMSGNASASGLAGQDVIIHLAGANVAARRWSPQYKEEIRKSRVRTTQILCRALAELKIPPKILLSASAVGFYGNRPPDETCDESSANSHDFLAEVCREWEEAAQPASEVGIRVIHLRFGVVLGRHGGALAKMLMPFRMGLGGPMGHGKQMMSWIALEEIPPIMNFIIQNEQIAGPVNVVSPYPVSNAAFSKVLGKVLHRPAFMPLPSFMVKILFGEMGTTLLLGGQTVLPKVLQDAGYEFQHTSLEKVLEEYTH